MSTVAIGSIAAAGIGAIGSGMAASTQAGAAENAQQLQATEAQNALNFQEQEWNTQQQNLQPWLTAGSGAINSLSGMLNANPGSSTPTSIGGANYNLQTGNGGSLEPWNNQFQAPTAQQAQQTPGYQFTLGQGEQAVQNSAAASGGLLTGGTLKGVTNYAEGLADTTYQQTYQNALSQYGQAYNQFQNNQANTFNRQAGVAGVGQTAATTLGSQGQAASSNVAGINLTTGQQQGQQLNNAGAATASGYAGVANSLSSGISNYTGAMTLQQLLAGQNQNQNSNNVPYGGY